MKTLLTLMLTLILSTSIAQNRSEFNCYRTEFTYYDESNKSWVIESTSEDLEMRVSFYKNVIYINAKTPSIIETITSSGEDISNDVITGTRWDAVMTSTKKVSCYATLAGVRKNKSIVLIINFEDGGLLYGLRYYIKKLGDE